jgi:lysozyme family protein
MTFDEAFDALLRHEGGYSDHAADPGGKTRFGVTEAVARKHGYQGEMKDYPVAEAKKVYRAAYWDALRLNDVRSELRFDLFDAAVNSGVAQTVKWVQRILHVADDGIMGVVTLNALATANSSKFLAKFNGQRLLFMTSLSTWPSFGRGWARRIAENLMR